MLAEIEVWLSKHFDLPMPTTHPWVQLASPARITALRYGAFKSQTSDANADGRDTVAVYDNSTQTIYLPEGWHGGKPAEMSLLVHEIVYHMQNQGKLKYECPQAREKLAYAAQARWLTGFGLTLESEFEVDASRPAPSWSVHIRASGTPSRSCRTGLSGGMRPMRA